MTHRQELKQFQAGIVLKDKNVIDWGSGSKPVFRYIQHDNCTFTTIDNSLTIDDDRRGDTHIIFDITKPITLDKFDVAFCHEVLEHVTNPEQVIRNIYNNLKSNGNLYLSAPFTYPIHGEQDYWRFTGQGLELLLTRNEFRINYLQPTKNYYGYIVEATRL